MASVLDDPLGSTFAALPDRTRRAILARLAHGAANVGALAAPFDMSFAAVSKHLRVLERAGLVVRWRDAQDRPATLDARPLAAASRWIDDDRVFWANSFDALDDVVTAKHAAASAPEQASPATTADAPRSSRTTTRKATPMTANSHETNSHETGSHETGTGESIEIVREFAAPPAAVFAAWRTPESFAQWFGGQHASVPLETLDYRAEAGRPWTATMVLPDGTAINWAGEFLEVDPPSRLVLTLTDQPAEPQRARLTVDLTPTDAGTRMRMTQQTPGFSAEQRQAATDGWLAFFDVLAALAEALSDLARGARDCAARTDQTTEPPRQTTGIRREPL